MHCRLLQQVYSLKQTDSLTASDLVKAAKIIFVEFELPKKIISDVGMNFMSRHIQIIL